MLALALKYGIHGDDARASVAVDGRPLLNVPLAALFRVDELNGRPPPPLLLPPQRPAGDAKADPNTNTDDGSNDYNTTNIAVDAKTILQCAEDKETWMAMEVGFVKKTRK